MRAILEGMLNDICGSDLFDSIYETLAINLFSPGGEYAIVYSAIKAVYNTIMPIGVMMMVIYFLIGLVDTMSSETFTWEQFYKKLAMLVVAKLIMENGFYIIESLFGIGLAVAAKVSAISGAGMEDVAVNTAEMLDAMESNITGLLSLFSDLIIFVQLAIPWALSFLMRLAVAAICYSRVGDIYARAAFAPIALSDFFHSGIHGSGFRFLKNFLASCLQGALILVIAIIFSKLFETLIITGDGSVGDIFAVCGKYLAFYAACIMLMFRSLPLAKELVGSM